VNRRLGGLLLSLSECSGGKKNLLGEISSEEVVHLLQDRLCKGDEMEVGNIALCCWDLFLHKTDNKDILTT
jgi:hypothetical protein